MQYPSYTERAEQTQNPVAKRLLLLMEEKQTNLCASADLTKAQEILDLVEAVGDDICVLKTHVDIIEDFTPDFPTKLRAIADEKNFLIFEDRKFADIGNTVSLQFSKGIYKIADWADIVNIHAPTSYVDLDIMQQVALKNKREIGLLVLAQMTPLQLEGAEFFDHEYAKKASRIAFSAHTHFLKEDNISLVLGFIGSSEQPEILQKLRNGDYVENEKLKEMASEMIIMTPGIKISKGEDDTGQTYNTPDKAIGSGSDIIIVGRGIYQADDPATATKLYKEAGWSAYQSRCN